MQNSVRSWAETSPPLPCWRELALAGGGGGGGLSVSGFGAVSFYTEIVERGGLLA